MKDRWGDRRWRFLHAAATLWRERAPALNELENVVSFGASHIKAMGVAVIAAIPLVIGSPNVAPAVTKEEALRCRAIQEPIQRRDCFASLREGSKAKAEEAAKAKTGNAPSPPAPDAPPTTSAVDHLLSVAPGQPLCVDRDALAAILAAGVLASTPAEAATNGCQAIPEGAKVEVLERYPNGLPFLRVIKVKVTSPALTNSAVGVTIETGR
jgi:hypothetical protein